MKKTRRCSSALLALLAVALCAPGTAGAVHEARQATSSTLEVFRTLYGAEILVDSSGFTVYEFTADRRKKDRCIKIKGCTEVWPPLVVSGTPTAGPGVNASLVGTINLSDGATQVTYHGHPLYTHPADRGPGETYYEGAKQFKGRWYPISPAGKKV